MTLWDLVDKHPIWSALFLLVNWFGIIITAAILKRQDYPVVEEDEDEEEHYSN